jgi:threonine dehydrogenase-like Zn-dependent dehydrogenase
LGVYPPAAQAFPLGEAMNKNLTVNMGNCNHRRYIAVCRDTSADPIGLSLSFRGATESACVDIRPDGYIPMLVCLVRSDVVDPVDVLAQQQPIMSAIEVFEQLDRRRSGWAKVELKVAA